MVSLSDDLANLVKAKVAEGRYGDEEAVIYAALNALRWQEEEDLRSVQRGLAQAEAGLGQPAGEAISEARAKYGLPPKE